jgi:hypothetical protein
MNELRLTCRLVKASKISWIKGKAFIKFVVVHFPKEGETVSLHCEKEFTRNGWEEINKIKLGATVGITGLITKRKDKGIIIDVVDIKERI